MKFLEYSAARPMIRTGDLIAFGGKGFISTLVRWRTRCPVTHVGGVYRNDTEGRVKLVESTMLYETLGVQETYLSEHITGYSGKIWWFRLSHAARRWFNTQAYHNWCKDTVGRPYDAFGAVGSAIDWLDWLIPNRRKYESLFCSEWYACGLQAAGLLSLDVNPSEETPKDVIHYNFYKEPIQLKGALQEIL